jgi:tetratricopeptide (TPR) repeat protein
MGYVQEAKGEMEKAYQSYKKAVLIQPNWRASHFSLAGFYRDRGLDHLALKYATKAIELNPLYPSSYTQRALSFTALGEFEKAGEDLQKALEINPDHILPLYSYGFLLIILKEYNKADKIISRREQIYPEALGNLALRVWLLAAIGEKDKALEIDFNTGNKLYKFRLYLIFKMKEEAIQYLDEDFNRRKKRESPWYPFLKNMSVYDFLRSDPRFQEILAKHKEIYEENLSKYGDIDI